MGLLSSFQDGFISTCGKYFLHQGAYASVPERPSMCDKCHSDSGCSRTREIYALGEDAKGCCIDTCSGMATEMAMPVLRSDYE